jgi:hypothetical protein
MGRPVSMPEPWRSLAGKMGGVKALAKAFGAPERSLRRWATGETPAPGPVRVILQQLCDLYHLTI